jgi:hypothetical protein
MADVLDQQTADRVFVVTVIVSPLIAGAVAYLFAQRQRSRLGAFATGFTLTCLLGIACGVVLGFAVDLLHGYYMILAFMVGGFLQFCISPVVGIIVGLLASMGAAYRSRAKGAAKEASP